MLKLDLKRIKNLRFLGTYILEKGSHGGKLPEEPILIGKMVSMYADYELYPTTHFIIEDGCKMCMRHASTNNCYSDWEEFQIKK